MAFCDSSQPKLYVQGRADRFCSSLADTHLFADCAPVPDRRMDDYSDLCASRSQHSFQAFTRSSVQTFQGELQ